MRSEVSIFWWLLILRIWVRRVELRRNLSLLCHNPYSWQNILNSQRLLYFSNYLNNSKNTTLLGSKQKKFDHHTFAASMKNWMWLRKRWFVNIAPSVLHHNVIYDHMSIICTRSDQHKSRCSAKFVISGWAIRTYWNHTWKIIHLSHFNVHIANTWAQISTPSSNILNRCTLSNVRCSVIYVAKHLSAPRH